MEDIRCYEDNRKWGQSPVDIDESNVVRITYPPLIMSGHWNQESKARLRNTGETIQLSLEGNKTPAIIHGGPLGDDTYEFAEMMFRWGSSDCKGAEHTLNGTWFTMEAQAVHFNKRYTALENCLDKIDGLAICVYLLQVYQFPVWQENPSFSKITNNLHDVVQAGSSMKIPANSLYWMKQACDAPGYFTYSGSITTSPYHECVTWIIFPEPVRISENQAQSFRMVHNEQGARIKENYRDVQKLNGRLIYYVS